MEVDRECFCFYCLECLCVALIPALVLLLAASLTVFIKQKKMEVCTVFVSLLSNGNRRTTCLFDLAETRGSSHQCTQWWLPLPGHSPWSSRLKALKRLNKFVLQELMDFPFKASDHLLLLLPSILPVLPMLVLVWCCIISMCLVTHFKFELSFKNHAIKSQHSTKYEEKENSVSSPQGMQWADVKGSKRRNLSSYPYNLVSFSF